MGDEERKPSLETFEGGEEDEEVDPPWGTISAERYLLQNWDVECTDRPDERRKKLIRAYVKAGGPPGETPTLPPPTASQITTILSAFRPLSLRKIATTTSLSPTIWLRTHYAPSSAPAHTALLASIDIINALDDPSRLLDNSSLYAFGPHWQRIFDLFPELVVCADAAARREYEAGIHAAQDALRRTRAVFAGSTAADDVAAAPAALIESARAQGFGEDEVQRMAVGAMVSAVHKACVVTYLIVEDEETLCEEGLVLLVFVDAYGDVVREKRVTAEQAEMMGGFWVNCSWDESGDWEDAVWGPEYTAEGQRGGLVV